MINKTQKILSGRAIKFFIVITLVAFTSYSYSQSTDGVLNLDALLLTALKNNPQLQSFRNAIRADSARIPQAGALPDPILSFTIMNLPTNSYAFDQEPMTGKQLSLMQHFPFPGKLSLQEDISSEGVAIATTNYHEYRNQIIQDIKICYFDLFFIDKSIEKTKKNQKLLEEFAEIAKSKYRVGNGLQQDVLKAQVELSKMMDKLIQLEQKRDTKQAQINTILNQPVNTPLGTPEQPDFVILDKSLDTLQMIATSNRPSLRGWELRQKQSRLWVDLAKKDYWPDISLYVAYTQREELQNGNPGHDFLSGGISLNIPLYSGSKQSQKVEETQYTDVMIRDRYAHEINQVNYELENKRSSAMKNARLVALFRTEIIPQASQSVKSALVGYQTDKLDFLTLLNNQITLFNYDIDYYRVLTDYNKDIASLEFLTGKQFEMNKKE